MELPAPLRSAVDQMLQGEPLERLAKASAILSDRYRREVRDGRFHIDDALALMTRRRFRHFPVVQDGTLVAFISIGDLVKHKMDEVQHEAAALRDYIQTV